MNSLNRRLLVLTALLLVPLGSGPLAGAAHAADSPDSYSWSVRTALSEYGSDRPKFTYTVKPGQRLTDGIDIANKGKTKITLKIYAADGFTTSAGGYDILTSDTASKGLGTWVTPHVTRITIPPHEQVQVPFTMKVPDNATPGDHLGGIVTVLDQKDPSGSGTVIHRRIGLRIETRVSGKVTPELTIEKLHLDYSGKNPFGTSSATVSYTVHNTGNTVLGGLQKVELASGFGLTSKSVDLPRLPNLLPGETWETKMPVDGVRAMLWVSAKVTVTPVVTDAAGSTTTRPPVTDTVRTVVSAWSFVYLAGFVIVVALLLWLLLVAVRRWRRSRTAKVDARVAAAVEEALQEKEKV